MNAGVASLLDLAAAASRLSGGLSGSAAQRKEMAGLRGVLNLEFRDGGAWHLEFVDGGLAVRRGSGNGPRATVKIAAEDFLALVAGDLAYSTARMTGKVRVAGDGNFGFVFGAFIEGLRTAGEAPGLRGWIGRRFLARALRKGGYTVKGPEVS